MSEGTLSEQGTLQLSRHFLKVSRKYEAVRYASFGRSPFWWAAKKLWITDKIRHERINKLRNRRQELVKELAVRYDGILRQLFTCAKPGTSFTQYLVQVWHTLQDRALTTRDYRLFSICLWDIQRDYGAGIDQLKARFMLKQFVDEMPRGEPRAALLTLAYGHDVTADEVSKEAARLVKKAYQVLHTHVEQMSHKEDLRLLTGGVLSREAVSSFPPSFVQYHEWFFQTC
jgi:hypothetical protein